MTTLLIDVLLDRRKIPYVVLPVSITAFDRSCSGHFSIASAKKQTKAQPKEPSPFVISMTKIGASCEAGFVGDRSSEALNAGAALTDQIGFRRGFWRLQSTRILAQR